MKSHRLLAIVGAIACSVLVVVPQVQPSPAQAAANLQTGKSAPGELLAGDPLTYTLTASNPGASSDPLYNLTFRDVLPLGVTYAGPTSPAEAGEPQIVTNQVPDTNPGAALGATIPQQTLIWSNVSDLQADDDFSITFAVNVNSTGDPARNDVHVIGAQISNVGESYAGTDPRRLPTFSATGEPIPQPTVVSDPSDAAVTTLTALQIDKSEPSPEGELLRGVHDQTTTYTITVDVTDLAPVSGITVSDYVPAALEFLGCGTVDNSAPGTEEYLNSGRLTNGNGGANCLQPDSVETVENPPADGTTTYPAGVYTKVTWTLPTLTAGVNVPYVITYAAGIPLFENRPFTGTVPTPQSRQQGSNLDNNTGPSTRELAGTERAVTNIARAVGTFDDAGLLEPGVPNATVADDARLTRTVEDLRIRKTVDTATGDFSSGAEATFHVYVDTSEYTSASGVVLTDIVPNGLCPLGNVAYSPPPTESQCGPSAANTPSPPFESVTLITTGTGGYTTVFDPIPVGALPANGSFDAVYRAFMRGTYEGGSLDGRPTVSGDSFTNTVSAVGTTTGIAAIRGPGFGAAVGDPLPGVQDGSSATLETRTLRLSKDILPRNVTPRLDVGTPVVDRCPDLNTGEPGASADQYISGDATPVPGDVETLGFRLGDQVCFRLRVDFDSSVETRNTLVTDFIPLGTRYVNGSARATAANSTTFTVSPDPLASPDLVDGPIEFQIGTPDATGRYVNLGGTFEVVFAVQVIEVPVADNATIAGNLMKMRTENSFGQAQSYRDAANFGIVPPPPVGVVKGVESVDTPAVGPNGAQSNVDGVQVRQGSAVTFRIDLENLGVAEDFTDYSARELEVLDVLPAQVDCTAITSITNFGPDSTVGECLDPGDTSGDSDYTNGFADQSVIRWAFDGSDPYALYPADYTASSVGDPSWLGVRSLFYTMTVPTPTSVSTRFDNNAGVRTYGGFTNLQGVVSPGYVPSNNIDPSLNGVSNAPDARDPSWVITPGPIVAKAGVTGIVETNNDAPVQAVPGETVTYTYGVTIPAQTTVFEGILSDALPNQVELIAPAAFGRFYPDAGSAIFEALPLLFGLSADGTLTFPATYTNATATDQRFEVVATTRVKPTVTGQPDPVTNTASFQSRTALGGQIVNATPASYDIAVRQPNPSLVKTNDAPAGVVVAGTVVQFTLRANNGGARPPLHDGVIVDCIPSGLAFTPGQPGDDAPTTGPVPGDGTNGCPAGTTLISYDIGTVEPATPVTRRYSATVEPTAVGGDVYRNDAELTGSTLDDGTNDPSNERVITTGAFSQVTVPGAGALKSVTPERATIGEQVTYTVRVVVPQDTNFYQAAIRDALPPGIDIDTIEFVSADCSAVAPNSCTLTSRWLPPVSTSDGGSLAALYVGDVTARPYARVVTLVYTARLEDIAGSIAGSTVVNRAQAVWDSTDKPEDPNVRPDGTWTNAGLEGSASVTVIEPSVTIDKTVSDASPEPGDPPFLYTVTLRNGPTAPANASDPDDPFYLVSAAYNGTLVDTVPAGVEVVTSSISDGGVYDATARTITWDASDLQGPLCGVWAASAGGGAGQGTCTGPTELDLTYSATLAPSTSLTTGQVLTNTADVTRYEGLPTSEPDANRRVYDGPQDSQDVTPDFPVLTTTKTASGEPTYIGDQYRWTVSVQNTGTGRAVATQIKDTLPPNWTYVTNSAQVTFPTSVTQQIEPNPGPCVGADLCWPGLGDLAPGQTVSLTYLSVPGPNVVATPGVGGATRHVNSATANAVDGGGYAGNLSGPYASTSTASTRIDRVDLAIDKRHTGSAIAGSNFSWSIIVSNLGPDIAVGSATKPFTVTDTIPTLPAGVTFASASGTGWTCTPPTGPASPPTTGTVTCRRTTATDTLASGASFPAITFRVRIPAATPDGTLISNTASVASPRTYESLNDLVNNTDTDSATIITRANLRIVKTLVSPPGLVAGTDSTYNLAITNLGPSVSRATATQPIVVSDTLPPTVSFVSATDTAGSPTFTCTHDGSATGGVVTCIRPTDMAVTSVATSNIRIVVRVPSGLTGNLTNRSTVTPGITTDPTPGDNTSNITNPIVERADLGITKTALGPNVPGEPTTYRLSVTNNGPGDASVRIQDTLPAGLTYRSFSNVAGNWTCAASTAPDPVPGFRCDLAGRLAFTPSPLNIVTVDVVVDTAPSVNGTVRNTAVVSTTAQDTNPNNNTAVADLTFAGVADLAVTKTATSTPVVPGGPIGWTVNVTNLGPSDSQPTIRVDDQLPNGVIGPVTAAGLTGADDWSCTVSVTRLVTCTKATKLAAGAQTNIRITAVVDPAIGGPTSIANAATVFPATAESTDPVTNPNTANNTGSVTVPVAEPAVTLTKAVDVATPQPGEQFTYTMTLTNTAGAATAHNMTVSDVLPAGIVWVSGGTLTGNTVSWTVPGPLAGGASTTVSFVAELAASTTLDTGAITNTAALDGFESLPTGGRTYPGNSDDAVITPVFPRLTAAKTALGPNPTYIDDEFAWEITITNTGGGDAAAVDVTDLLPLNWTYVTGSTTVTAPSGVTTPDPTTPIPDLDPDPIDIEQQLTWLDVGALAPNQSLTVAFRATPTRAVADKPGVGSGQAHTNRASATTTDNAGFTGNRVESYVSNTPTADAFIDSADLEIRKLNAATPAIAGENYSWTLETRNLGDDPAVGPFTVVDTLPSTTPALTFVSATGAGWNCTEASGVVTCTRGGSLPAPAFADDPAAAFPDITVTVAIPSDYLSAAGMTNTATIAGRTFDPVPDNNLATALTPVSGLADLAITKRHTNATVTAGSNITYELVVRNIGPSTSRATISVVDTLPPNTTFVSASNTAAGDAWNCVNGIPAAGQVTCTLTGDILTSTPAEAITITVALASNAPNNVAVVNEAEVIPGATPEGAADPTDPDDPKVRNNFASDSVVPNTSADLIMDKRSIGQLVPGETGVYRLRVDNVGPSDANAPTITDTLPPGLTFAGYTSNPADVVGPAPGVWTCSATSADLRTFTCTLDRALVTPGFSVVDIDVDIDPTLQGPIVNTATVTSTTPDPDTDNNTDTDNTGFTTLADLAIVKTGPTAPVIAGATFDWTLTISNNGPSVSREPIRVSDALPDSVVLVTDVTQIAAPWSCTSAPATVVGFSTDITCTLAGDLPAPDDAPANVAPPITFTVRALPDAGPAVITNRATVQGTTTEPAGALGNNTSSHDVTLIDDADLQILKTPDIQTVTAGEDATFTLSVTNNGLSTADDVVVSDPLPPGMTIALPFTATGWDCSLSTTVLVDCRLATLDPGAADPITVVAKVASSVPPSGPQLTNLASVASSTPDSNIDNNEDDAVVNVQTDADLGITKTHPATPDPVVAGTTVEFEMIVTNTGPSDAAAGIVVTDTLPAGFSYLSARGSWTCAPRLVDPQIIDCTKLGGGLAAGDTADTLFVLTQTDPAMDAGSSRNTATVDSPTPDSNSANDVATDDVNIGNQADVSIVKSHDGDLVRIGDNLVFTLAVSNAGPSEARDVVVTDTLPAGLTLVSAAGIGSPSTWDCSATAGQQVDCRHSGPLTPSDAERILVTALVEPAAFPTISNTAEVRSSTPDDDLDNNTSTDVVTVPRLVDLFITKTHTGPVAVGKPIVYTLTVGNNGPIDDVAVVTVTDAVPPGLRVTGATSAAADCSIAAGVVTCTKDDGLAVGATFTVIVTADVLAGAYPSVTNTATVSSPTDDKDLTNNTAADPAVVPPLVDLAITKTHAGTVQVGGQITYTLTVRNNGPTPDPGPVRVLDTLPGSLTPVSATAGGMTCDITGQTVACTALGPLGVNAELVITIVADVGPAASPSVSNTAIVTTPGCSVGPSAGSDPACPDTDLTNNQATDVATVTPLILLGLDKSLASLDGSTATWSLVVTNTGPNDTVEPIRLVDNLPSTLVFVSATGTGWVCEAFQQIVGCTYAATLSAGAAAAPVTIVTTVDAPAGTEVVNIAGVDGGGPDVPAVTDDANLVASAVATPGTSSPSSPSSPSLPNTGGGPGLLLRWAPLMVLLGLALVAVANRRRPLTF